MRQDIESDLVRINFFGRLSAFDDFIHLPAQLFDRLRPVPETA